jgi:hypothetical protein
MILDSQWIFSDQQVITVTAPSTNVIDLGFDGANFDFGRGTPIPLLVQVTETFTAGGAGTLTVVLQTDTDVAFGSPVTVITTPALALAFLVAGYQIAGFQTFPNMGPLVGAGTAKLERYVRLNYTIATGPMLTGKITAGLTSAVQTHRN